MTARPPEMGPRNGPNKTGRPERGSARGPRREPITAAPGADGEAPADPGLPARLAAIELMRAARARRGGLDEALNLPGFRKLSPQERGFARALAMAALRNHGRIERYLGGKLEKKPNPDVLDLMRIGVAQLIAMDTPDFAAVATTVKLAERDGGSRPFKGLINAVLRGLIRDGLKPVPPGANAPDWLFQRWKAVYGPDGASAIAKTIPVEPPTDLTLKDPAQAEALAAAVEGEILPGGSLRVNRKGDVAGWPGFEEGGWWVQDAAAAVPARLFDLKPGQTVLDLCAAPGGKTLQLAATGATVTAVDRSASRLKRLHENLERTGLKAEVVTADGETWTDERKFDAVLLDAPCTSTGTFRRNPDVLWATGPADIAKLADVQHRLMDAAAARVKPGGTLVYCVCSLEREEGETQALAFLKRHPEFVTAPVQAGEGGAPEAAVTPEGWLRLLPSQWLEKGGLDGFFAARFSKA